MSEAGFGTLRNPSDCSVLSHSLNTVYAVRFAHANCSAPQLRKPESRYMQLPYATFFITKGNSNDN